MGGVKSLKSLGSRGKLYVCRLFKVVKVFRVIKDFKNYFFLDSSSVRRNRPKKFYRNCRITKWFPERETFEDSHNERCAGAYFLSNTPAYGCVIL